METRRKLTLPSGAHCTVRKLSGFDFTELGTIPEAIEAPANVRKPAHSAKANSESVRFGVNCLKLALCKACSVLTFPDGSKLKIVDKEIDDDLAPEEITLHELSDADAQAIFLAVRELSGLTKEASDKAQPFPAEQSANGDAAPTGEALRQASV